MKKTIISFLSVAAIFALAVNGFATGSISYNPGQVAGGNPSQTGVLTITNLVPAVITNTVSFPFAFSSPPVMQFIGTATNFSSNPLTNTVTTTNFTTVSVNTNCSITWIANIGYPRVQSGINGLGSFVSGAVAITNTFTPPFAYVPVVNLEGNGSLFATNAGLWATVTTSNLVITTGNTNQIIYWGAFGISAAPGISLITY